MHLFMPESTGHYLHRLLTLPPIGNSYSVHTASPKRKQSSVPIGWYEDNAESIAFGQFYRENFPKQYRDWQTGRWQQDIAYRDSLRHAHSLDRLKRLYSPAE